MVGACSRGSGAIGRRAVCLAALWLCQRLF